MYTWMLAAGYAESDPEKAFPILEEAIGRANDLISAFITVGEFIDVTEEMISEGEVQVGSQATRSAVPRTVRLRIGLSFHVLIEPFY